MASSLPLSSLRWQLRTSIRHLRLLADRLAWLPAVGGWRCEDQYFTWSEADYKVKWDSARALLTEVATTRPDFRGLETGLSTQSYRHLKRKEEPEDLSHIVFRCPHWHKERRD
eukprot:5036916-Amphidinium_carterae.1